ncbi:hypothetical protein [Nocardia seriolae]|uniref:Uncharacterized protein n=1 Tax=Nocardia seriolae TaxID=37332 RepID=A0ABC8AZ51_9NOCA|nr:hypothetical protein [Nocardia seriolae]APA99117.1 hypothetical protein NS506_05071 [Nocardia seriolae]MTJ63477.1 hypothetical protein [Nocardia seriolae]MTJ73797.1 hypothetical protein [Nocardia seriolae]MTJ88722.1 hypothetical protein [Nocardia seriolae]MTK32701.1 hypothetical protein [Nocardia seriolae]
MTEPWNVPGLRLGWRHTETCAHIVPATGTVLLPRVGMDGPAPDSTMRDFWSYTATFDAG